MQRLRAQAELSWPREAVVLARLGLRDGMSILEPGSGPGFITELLLQALPNARVTAVELDPLMAACARSRLARYPSERLEIVESSILCTDLPDAHFDFALARYVFQHLAAPDMAASEIFRLLKPGGRLVIADVDDGTGGLVVPELPEFELLAGRLRELQASYAGDRKIGRKLWRLLAEAGYGGLDLEVVAYHSDQVGLDAFRPQYDPERYRGLIAIGALSQAEWERYAAAYATFLATPSALILQLIMLVSGRKP